MMSHPWLHIHMFFQDNTISECKFEQSLRVACSDLRTRHTTSVLPINVSRLFHTVQPCKCISCIAVLLTAIHHEPIDHP